jgi:hypothetical protein
LIVEIDLIVKLNWDELVVLYVEMSGCLGAKCESQVRGREEKKGFMKVKNGRISRKSSTPSSLYPGKKERKETVSFP